MDSKEKTLHEVVLAEGKTVKPEDWAKVFAGAGLALALGALAAQSLGALEQSIIEEVGKLLDTSIFDYLMAGWGKAYQVLDAIKESKEKPKDPTDCTLATHTVKSVQPVVVEVYQNGVGLGPIEFDVTTEFVVDGLVLHLLNGEIREVRAGTCQGSVRLKYKDIELLKGSTTKFPLPGVVKLKDQARPAAGENADITKTGEHPKIVAA